MKPDEPKAADPDAPAEGGEPVAPAFKKELYTWTKTNGKLRNLPQLFTTCKQKEKTIHEIKPAEHYSSSQWEAISRSLDEFCIKVTSDPSTYVYQQIIFSE